MDEEESDSDSDEDDYNAQASSDNESDESTGGRRTIMTATGVNVRDSRKNI